MAQMKGERWYILFAHSMIYATVISFGLMVFQAYAVWKLGVILASHMIIDKWKASKPKDKEHWHLIYYDQAGHILINSLLLVVQKTDFIGSE